METVAFYSYKGGVSRSLLLANAAWFLARRGKGVVALDFDFEAPVLHYRFGVADHSGLTLKGGAVPYLNASVRGSKMSPLAEHTLSVPLKSRGEGWVTLMPAGPAPSHDYWAALKTLGEWLRLSDPSGRGVMAILDLQARIAEELEPDYLLIDARTGVTELGSLATTILADTVVCLFTDMQESLDGTLLVAEALRAAPRLASQKPVRIVPVKSRTSEYVHERGPFKEGIARRQELGQLTSRHAIPDDGLLRFWGDNCRGTAMVGYHKLFRGIFPGAILAKQPVRRPKSK